jgi:hypothetical protein
MKSAPQNAKDDIDLLFSELLANELAKRNDEMTSGRVGNG